MAEVVFQDGFLVVPYSIKIKKPCKCKWEERTSVTVEEFGDGLIDRCDKCGRLIPDSVRPYPYEDDN